MSGNDEGADGASRNKWEGLAELDRSLAENQLTEYRIKKAWADPIERLLIIAVLVIVAVVFGYLGMSRVSS